MYTRTRHIVLLLCLAAILAVTALLGCGSSKQYTCWYCDDITRTAYYSEIMDKEHVLCEDCARPYWYPFSYKNYRVD